MQLLLKKTNITQILNRRSLFGLKLNISITIRDISNIPCPKVIQTDKRFILKLLRKVRDPGPNSYKTNSISLAQTTSVPGLIVKISDYR